MARIEPKRPRDWSPEMPEALAAITPPAGQAPPPDAARPRARNLLGTFAHNPALAKAYFSFNGHILWGSTISARQRELLVLRVASLRDCRYEWGQHLPLAADAGLDDDEISRVASEPGSPQWSDVDAALLRAVDDLVVDGAIGETTWAALAAEFDPPQLLDIIATVGAYETVAWIMRSVDIDLDDDLLAVLARFEG